MIQDVRKKVEELLSSKEIEGFLGLCSRDGHTVPHLFRPGDDLADMVLGDLDGPGDVRYPLNKKLTNLARAYPELTFGVLVRGCDERGLKSLFTWNQLSPQRVVPVGIACPQELAKACECRKPYPDEFVGGEKAEGCASGSVADVEDLALDARFSMWMKEFAKCIKCYGCRDVCPMCFCRECTLDNDELIRSGEIPPEIPIFHLVRAVHMAGRCIDCGLCTEACPADIPLRTLYKKVNDIMDEEFSYRPGYEEGMQSPLSLLGPAPED
jgi:ferredoxin